MSKATLYAETIRHLRPTQIAWNLYRRVVPSRRVKAAHSPLLVRQLRTTPFARGKASFAPPGSFTFLNRTETFEKKIDWQRTGPTRLWLYNLHYFDYLADPALSTETAKGLIENWISGNPQGTEVGWEPYPVSLRVVNWIKFHLARESLLGPEMSSLYLQLRWLFAHREFHIGANHLLKNAKALLYGGVLFEGREAERWLTQGIDLFRAQVAEQVLDDGGHYERSFMYHAIATEDVLDVANLLVNNPQLEFTDLGATLLETGREMVQFLSSSLHPDGEIPLFNDAAFEIAPSGALAAYVARIDTKPEPPAARGFVINHDVSGYFGYRTPSELLLIDCGPMGPKHQPGHAHCDTLSLELSFAGRRVIVDSGTYDYEASDFRHYLRSTAAHNTVRIDDCDQSQIWGTFRLGRRARPVMPRVQLKGEEFFRFEGSHDGFRHLPGRPIHTRVVEAWPEQRWAVHDRISGSETHVIESFLHFHPDLTLDPEAAGSWLIKADGERFARISFQNMSAEQHQGVYCPQFGVCFVAPGLLLKIQRSLPTEFGFVIERL